MLVSGRLAASIIKEQVCRNAKHFVDAHFFDDSIRRVEPPKRRKKILIQRTVFVKYSILMRIS